MYVLMPHTAKALAREGDRLPLQRLPTTVQVTTSFQFQLVDVCLVALTFVVALAPVAQQHQVQVRLPAVMMGAATGSAVIILTGVSGRSPIEISNSASAI